MPPAIEQPTSDVRDEMPDTSANGASLLRPDAQADQEMTDAPADAVAPNTTIVDEPSIDEPAINPPVSSDAKVAAEAQTEVVDAKVDAQQNEKMDIATPQETDAATTGHVRPREEDDEGEPAAKRARVGEETEAAALPDSTSLAPAVPDTSVAGDGVSPLTTPAVADASQATPTAPAAPGPSGGLATPQFDSQPLTSAQTKFLLDRIRQAKKVKSARNFMNPVDHVLLNIPSYPTIVTSPMDLSTMEEKMKKGEYGSASDVAADMDLIVSNTNLFNGTTHPVSVDGANLRAYFFKTISSMPRRGDATVVKKKQSTPSLPKPAPVRRESRQIVPPVAKSPPAPKPVEKQESFALNTDGMPTIRRDSSAANNDRPKREIHPPKNRDLPYAVRPKKKKTVAEFKFCDFVLSEMNKKRYAHMAWPFLYPVDPVALNIPTYFKIVKKPTDLGTIKMKLDNGEFNTAKEFHAEVKLMFQNCYKFNPVGDNIHELGKQLEVIFDELWATKEEWIANNTRSEVASADEEEEDDVPSEDEVNPQVQRMLEIQQQINALTAEAMQLSSATIPTTTRNKSPKQGSKKSKKASTGAPKAKRTSSVGGAAFSQSKSTKVKKSKPKKLSLDDKRFVSEGIASLDESQMRRAVQIIRNGVPTLRVSQDQVFDGNDLSSIHIQSLLTASQDVQDDELELDIDEIPDHVVYDLFQFVKKLHPQSAKQDYDQAGDNEDDDYDEDDESYGRPAGKGAGGGRKKNKPMSAREQESKIAQVQAQLQQFQPGGSGSEDLGGKFFLSDL